MQYYISIHAPLAGCDPGLLLLLFFGIKISIHAPLAGCDRPARRNRQSCAHFNPRTPCGVRPSRSCSRPSTTATFQSTHPLRGATALHQREIVIAFPFQSTHPLRGATIYLSVLEHKVDISIHAPLAGCDERVRCVERVGRGISIHAPLAGCDSTPRT